MILNGDIRCASDDAQGLLEELQRRDKSIDALAYQVERSLNDQGRDYGLLQTTVVLEDQIRQRTEELTAALEALGEVSARATAARLQLETAVENISDGFALFDPEDRVLLCNEAFCQLDRLAGDTGNRPLGDVLAETAGRDLAAGRTLLPTLRAGVFDNVGCSALATSSVTNPPLLTASIAATNPKCYGDNNGVLNLTPAGGTAPYTFAWSTGVYYRRFIRFSEWNLHGNYH